ncbi:MAG: IS66 family insertion sequence element accessory protein TnpB [Oscillospiraceae bacterium]|nr:IS66 family insertion sequence element accessory protein TnpB [Oscillospiraceae bacterium]
MEAKTTALAAVKQDVRLQEWSAQIEAQQASGLTVRQWCIENGVKPKTYYYHLKKVREQFLDSSPTIVPLNVPQQSADIRIEKNDLHISLPTSITQDTLLALVNALC